jgi:hypothetical protein
MHVLNITLIKIYDAGKRGKWERAWFSSSTTGNLKLMNPEIAT